MCLESLSSGDLEVFQKSLAAATASARSLDEIKTWLKSQQRVKSVQLAEHKDERSVRPHVG
jgi:hypothetical protein